MARKRTINRRELREEAEAVEHLEETEVEQDEELEDVDAESEEEEDEDEEGAKPAKKKPAAKRKSRAKTVKEVRLKAFWGVFNQSMKRVALFEYAERAGADKKAAELSESQKNPHFVQIVKEVIEQ